MTVQRIVLGLFLGLQLASALPASTLAGSADINDLVQRDTEIDIGGTDIDFKGSGPIDIKVPSKSGGAPVDIEIPSSSGSRNGPKPNASRSKPSPGHTAGRISRPKPGHTAGRIPRPKPGHTAGRNPRPKPGHTTGRNLKPKPGHTVGRNPRLNARPNARPHAKPNTRITRPNAKPHSRGSLKPSQPRPQAARPKPNASRSKPSEIIKVNKRMEFEEVEDVAY